jgi:hypothetical protein
MVLQYENASFDSGSIINDIMKIGVRLRGSGKKVKQHLKNAAVLPIGFSGKDIKRGLLASFLHRVVGLAQVMEKVGVDEVTEYGQVTGVTKKNQQLRIKYGFRARIGLDKTAVEVIDKKTN